MNLSDSRCDRTTRRAPRLTWVVELSSESLSAGKHTNYDQMRRMQRLCQRSETASGTPLWAWICTGGSVQVRGGGTSLAF